jgi:hypothetical protein
MQWQMSLKLQEPKRKLPKLPLDHLVLEQLLLQLPPPLLLPL